MKTIIINGVRCTLESRDKLCLELPSGMTGEQLRKWKDASRADVLAALSEDSADPSEENTEPELREQG